MEKYTKRLPISCSKVFDLSPEGVWEMITAPGNLNATHPFCDTNEALVWDGENHSDRLVYLNGRTYVRNFQTWDENKGYTLLIGEDNGAQSYVVWEIESVGENKSKLSITVYPFILAKLPKFLAFIPHLFWVKPRMTAYLNSVLGGFAYFCETGESVPRNHFGSHKWFS